MTKFAIEFTISERDAAMLRKEYRLVEPGPLSEEELKSGGPSMRFRVVVFDGLIDPQVHETSVLGEPIWNPLGATGRMFHGCILYGPSVTALALRRLLDLAPARLVRKTEPRPDIVFYDIDGYPPGEAPRDIAAEDMEFLTTALASRARAQVVEARLKEINRTLCELGAIGESGGKLAYEMVLLVQEQQKRDIPDLRLAQILRGEQCWDMPDVLRLAREVDRWRRHAARDTASADVSDPLGLDDSGRPAGYS